MTENKINYIFVGLAAFWAVSSFHGLGFFFKKGSIRSVENKVDSISLRVESINSRIPPIQVYEGNILGNTNSERFVQADGIRFYSHVDGKSVDNYVNDANTLKTKLEELR